MNALRGTAVLSLALASAAGAQNKGCKIEDGKPFQLASARIYLQKATSGKPDEKPKHLQNSVKVLTENADRIGNPVGRNWMIGRSMVQWLDLRGPLNFTATRGELGYATDPNAPVNILAVMDTVFAAVEQQAPECADTTTRYRRYVWGRIINASQSALGNGQLDSAEYYAQQSMLVYRKSPHAPNILAMIALRKNDIPNQIKYYQQTIELSGTDTSVAKLRKSAMFNLGVLKSGQAEAASGEQQKALYREAAEIFRTYNREFPGDPNGQQGLARALNAMGDTAAVAGIYAEMLANPDKFTEGQLFEAGVAAYAAKKYSDAAKLYEMGLTKNPYDRAALGNAAATYFVMNDPEHMGDVVRRLIEIEPSNAENYKLMAGVYQIRQRAATDDKLKKPLTDSILKYLDLEKSLPVHVQVTQFSHSGARHQLAGTVKNRSKAAASYQLKFEFLDKDGKVVARQNKDVGPVNPDESKEFTINVVQSGIVGYRYAKVP